MLDHLNIKFDLVKDVAFAFFSRLAPKAVSTLFFIILMRKAGSETAGVYNLSVSFLTFAIVFSSFGLDELTLREVAKAPSSSRRYLVNTLVLRLLLAILGYLVLVGVVIGIMNYTPEVRRIILIQGLSLIPQSLLSAVFDIFNANRKFNWMALSAICTSLFQLLVGVIALWVGAGLEPLTWLIVVGNVIGVGISLFLSAKLIRVLVAGTTQTRWYKDFSWEFCFQQLGASLPFVLLIVLVSLDSELDVILLSKFCTIEAVGEYSAARTLVLALSLLSQAMRMVIYPSMARAYVTSSLMLKRVYNDSWYYLALVGLPLSVGGAIISSSILGMIYREVAAATVWSFSILMIHLAVGFLYLPSTRLIVVSGRQADLSLLLGTSVGLNVFLSFLLVPQLGAVGSALTRAVSSLVYFFLAELYVNRKLLAFRLVDIWVLLCPILATLIMGYLVWSIRDWPWYAVVSLGGTAYGGVFLLLHKWACKKRYASS